MAVKMIKITTSFVLAIFLFSCNQCKKENKFDANILANSKLLNIVKENENNIISLLSKNDSIKPYTYLIEDIKSDLNVMKTPAKLNTFDAVRIGERLEIAAKLGLFTPPDAHPQDDPEGFFRGFNKCEEEEGSLKMDGTIEWSRPTAFEVLACKLKMVGIIIKGPRPNP